MSYPNVSDEERMARINQDIQKASQDRRALLERRFEEFGVEGVDVKAVLRVCDTWVLSNADIDAVVFGNVAREGKSYVDRLRAIQEIETKLSVRLDHDQIRCAQWIRRATMELEGFRPLDCLKGEADDLRRVSRILTR